MLSSKITEQSTNPYIVQLIEAGRRASDLVNTYALANDYTDISTKWIAIRLEDGTSDGVLYDSKQEAVKHQFHEQQCAYFSFKNKMGGTNPRDMAVFIQFTREAYQAGFRLVDPESSTGGREVLMTSARRDDLRERLGF